jgi:hypothetical protein
MIKELIERLNNETIEQTTCFEEQKELDPFLQDWYVVATNLFIDKHRWYEKSIHVLKHTKSDNYIGVESITLMYSESAEYDDFNNVYKFYEMQPIQHISYNKID